MGKKRRKKPAVARRAGFEDDVLFPDYTVTFEPLMEPVYARLPRRVKDTATMLHFLAQDRPDEAIPELLALIGRYPNVPQFYNYLFTALHGAGRYEAAVHVCEETCRRFPDYLFGRLNSAEFHLARGETEKFAEILDHKFDLHLLYPQRKRFHVSEFIGLLAAVGRYRVMTGDRAEAERILALLERVEADHPATDDLRRRLSPTLRERIGLWLLERRLRSAAAPAGDPSP